MRDKGGKKIRFVDSCQSCLAFASVLVCFCSSGHEILFFQSDEQSCVEQLCHERATCLRTCCERGRYECLPETNNSNDAKAIAVRSASNHWTRSCTFVRLRIGPLRPFSREISNVVVSIQTTSKSRYLYRLTSQFK